MRVVWILLCAGLFSATAWSQDPLPDYEPNPAAALPPPQPKRTGAKIDVVWTGNTAFDGGDLNQAIAEQIATIEESGLTPALADDAAFFTQVFYLNRGYSQVEVTETILSPARLRLAIREGPLTELGEVTIRGNTSYTDEQLREYVIGPTRERFSRLKGDLPYIESDVTETGVDNIRGLYQAQGYLDAEVPPAEVRFSRDKRRADVTITVKPGIQYQFGDVNFTGDLPFAEAKVREVIESFVQKPYTEFQVVNMQRALAYYYKTQGYYRAKVTAESDKALAVRGRVPVLLRVDSGKLYRFDGVSVEGTDRLRPTFLVNRFQGLSGEVYSPEKTQEIFRKLMQTGLFKQLKVNLRPVNEDELEINLKAEEAKAKELGFSLGYGTFEGGIFGVQAGDRNLFGNGRPLNASLEYSQRYIKGEILYEDPWFLETDYELQLKLSALSTDFDGYSKFEVGFRPEVTRQITEHYKVSVFALARQVNVTNRGIDVEELGPTSYLASSLGLSQTLDTRDSALNPRGGLVFNSTVDYGSSAFGSQIEFVRTTARLSYYIPLMKKTLLALGARGGVIKPLGMEELPIDERFFNGGSRSVRSFNERELGPKDSNGFEIGGETFTIFNIEYVFPIFGDLLGATFLDAGSVGRRVEDGIGEMRYGVGAGLRYNLPVGPLRLDYGYNPSPREDEALGAFHFSFGFAF